MSAPFATGQVEGSWRFSVLSGVVMVRRWPLPAPLDARRLEAEVCDCGGPWATGDGVVAADLALRRVCRGVAITLVLKHAATGPVEIEAVSALSCAGLVGVTVIAALVAGSLSPLGQHPVLAFLALGAASWVLALLSLHALHFLWRRRELMTQLDELGRVIAQHLGSRPPDA